MKPQYGTLLALMAAEIVGTPGWRVYGWDSKRDENGDVVAWLISGQVAPLNAKGRPDWLHGDRSTEREVCIAPARFDVWAAAWSKRTGKCLVCAGDGRTPKSISVTEGTTWRECRGCGGSGKAGDDGGSA